MATRIFGASDDLIEFEGDVTGEVGYYQEHLAIAAQRPALIVCSDGTILTVLYGKNDLGIWAVSLLHRGTLLNRIDQCDSEDADIYSDVAYFGDGLKWAYVASMWGRVK